MKALRIGLYALAASVVAVIAVALFLVATFDANRHKDRLVELVHERSGRTLAIDGDIGLSVFPRLAFTAAGLRLSESDGHTPFAAIDEVEFALRVMPLLRGEVRVDRVRVIRPQISYRRSADGRSNLDDLFGAASADSAETSATGDRGARGGGADEGGAAFSFDIDGVELLDARIDVDDAAGGLKGTLSGLSLQLGRLQPDTPTALALAAALDLSEPALRGKVDLRARLSVGSARVAFDDLVLDLSLQPGARVPLVLAVRGAISHLPAEGSTQMQLKGRFDDSAIDARIDSARDRPLSFALQLDRLDLDRYTAAAPLAAAGSAPAATPPAGAPPTPASAPADGDAQAVDLAFAGALAFNGRVDIGELRAAGLTLSALSATLAGDGRELAVAPLSARGYGGSLSGEVRIDSQSQRVRTRQSYVDIQIGPLLRDLAAKDVLEGRGRLDVDLDTRGRTVGELKRALAGSATLALRDGAIKGFNLGQILRDGQALLSGRRDQSHEFRRTEQTDFSSLDASLRIAAGVARNDDLALLSPLLRVGGAGLVDIGANRIDYTLRAAVVASVEGQGGAGLEQLRGLTVPVRLRGPLEAPAAQVLWSEVAGDAARRALGERLERALGSGGEGERSAPATPEDALKEELGRRLRGLLR